DGLGREWSRGEQERRGEDELAHDFPRDWTSGVYGAWRLRANAAQWPALRLSCCSTTPAAGALRRVSIVSRRTSSRQRRSRRWSRRLSGYAERSAPGPTSPATW